MKKIIWATLISLSFADVYAMNDPMLRSPTGLLMGDAYTALSDDAYGVFYNPASLARSDRIRFSLIAPMGGVTRPDFEGGKFNIDRFEKVDYHNPNEIADAFADYPVFAGGSILPQIKAGPFALTGIFAADANMIVKNKVNPIVDFEYAKDTGVMLSYALRFGSATNAPGMFRLKSGDLFAIGANVRYVQREEMKNKFDLFGTKLIGDITNGKIHDFTDFKRSMGARTGTAVAFDVGAEYSMILRNTLITFGGAVTDIGDTDFELKDGVGELDPEKMRVNVGAAISQRFAGFDYRLAADYSPLNDDTIDAKSKMHVGIDLGFPFLRLLAGYNGGYFNYGTKLRLWPIEIVAGFYSAERGYAYRQRESKRAMIYVSLLDFSFKP